MRNPAAGSLIWALQHTPHACARDVLERRWGRAALRAAPRSGSVFGGDAFASFIRQHRVRADNAAYRLDMYDAATRTAAELDGRAAHEGPDMRERDTRRDARLAAIGILTLRFGYRDLVERPQWCRQLVVSTLRVRRRPPWA